MNTPRLSREAALSFLLTHIVVECELSFEMNPMSLFALTTVAAEAESRINNEQGAIPHEIIEELAMPFIESI